MKFDHQLRVLSCSEENIGTQRCHLSAELMQDIGARLGSAARIIISKDVTILCTVWPRQDKHNGYIEFSDIVTIQTSSQNYIHGCKKTISLADLEIIDIIHVIKVIHVDIIVSDYTKVCKWNKFSSESKFKVAHMLRKLILCPECQVNIKQTAMEHLFGVSWVKVKSIKCLGRGEVKLGRCGSKTDILIDNVLSAERYEQKLGTFSFTINLGGLHAETELLKEMVQLTLLCPKTNCGFKLPSGVLLLGPPGCGKTTLVYHVARETNSYLEVINGAEIFGSRPGETEQNLRNAFEKAAVISEEGPCILFLDEIDSLCPASGHGSVEQRTTSMLINLIDKLILSGRVTVIGSTNNSGAVDAAVRRPGRLEKEILIGVPRLHQRIDILKVLTSSKPLHNDVDLTLLAASTPGYVGADLESLVQQAHYAAVRELLNQSDHQSGNQTSVLVRNEHFKSALHKIIPSTQRGSDILVDYKPIKWQEIGGLEDVKIKLKQRVEWPLKHPEAFSRLGLPHPRGILLYGPPGCGKTTLVRAVATSCHVTFLAINGGQLYSPYVGDSERTLMQAFQQARAGAPSVLFIDEIDSVIGARRHGAGKKSVQERVLSTLLNEMDGIGIKTDDLVRSGAKVAECEQQPELEEAESGLIDNSSVLLVAATNRPDMIDDAILRPGRIDHIIYVPPPDKQARVNILQVHTRKMHLDDTVLDQLAARTDGFTGADLESLCREAALFALSQDGISTSRVTYQHFLHILKSFKPSLTAAQIVQYSKMKSKLQLKSS